MDKPTASIIVPLAGSPIQAERCFQGIAAQPDDPSFEVIIVDDASVGLEQLLASLAGDVEIVRSDRRVGFAGAIRLGLERAQGETVVIVRDAAQPAHDWLPALVNVLEDPTVGLATSATAGAAASNPVATWSAAVRARDLRDVGLADVANELVIPALALSLAERGLHTRSVPASAIAAPGARTGGARRAPGESPELTIVIPTLDAASERVRSCIASVQAATDVAHEIVIVDNGCPPQGFASPVNSGLRAARTPYMVVMNDDVEPLPGWWTPLRDALDRGARVAFPLTVDGVMRHDFAAWCFAMSRQTIDEFSCEPGEFFDPSLVVWYQDTDLLHRLRKAGNPPRFVEASRIRHGLSQTVNSDDPALKAWIKTQVALDQETFLRKHPELRDAA
jgi:GT2 family glycosyltransferase